MPAKGSSELQKAVDRLIKTEPGWKEATRPPARGGKAGSTSTGRPTAGQSAISLIEPDASAREYWAPRTLRSTDGVLTIEVAPIKTVVFADGSASFAEPAPND